MDLRTREGRAMKAAMAAKEAVTQIEAEPLEAQPVVEDLQKNNKPTERDLIMSDLEAKQDARNGLEEPKVEEPAKVDAPVEPAQVEAEAVVVEPEPPKTVKVKINGKESEVQESEIEEYGSVKAYQIAKAAELKLEEAKELTAKNHAAMAQFAQWAQQQQQPKATAVQNDDETIATLDAALFSQNPQDRIAAYKKLQSQNQPKIDQNIIIQQAVRTMEFKNAGEKFKQEFADVVANPNMLRLAISYENERLPKVSADTDFSVFYRTIGNEVRNAFGKAKPAEAEQATSGKTSQESAKEARKASIVTLPTATARAQAPVEEKEETRDEMLSRVRKSRNL